MKTINLIFFFCTISLLVTAHEEPSKTLNEKKGKEKAKMRVSDSGEYF
ncbi:MAG: hypothetical protein HY738_00720 [Bacteroidia bacterium]|nr:hypothetical protein [Bacteroidia bacterium]